jgi:hypothetical protein
MRMTTITTTGRRATRRPRPQGLRPMRHRDVTRTRPVGGMPSAGRVVRDRRPISPPRNRCSGRVATWARRGWVRWTVSGPLALLTLVGAVPTANAEDAATSTTARSGNVVAQPPPPPGGSGLGTGGVRTWILDNLIPLLLLAVALLLLWLGGGKGDNAGIMKRLGGVLVALAIVGLAVTTDAGKNIGVWLAGLFAG